MEFRRISDRHVDLVRRGFAAFAAGDLATLDGLLADDVVWHSMGRNPFAGEVRGKQEVLAHFARVAQLVAGRMQQDLHAVIADEEHAVALVTSVFDLGDRRAETRSIYVFHIADGRLSEAWISGVDQYATDEVLNALTS